MSTQRVSLPVAGCCPAPPVPPAPAPEPLPLKERVIEAIKRVYDPEIPVNVYDLGLIYNIRADAGARWVHVTMTLTTPNCTEAQVIPERVSQEVEHLADVDKCQVDVVFDPPWNREMMSLEARVALDMM